MDGRCLRVGARMSDSPDHNLTFEQSLAELDRIVRDLEDGQLGLEDALSRYEAGVGLLKRCYAQLRQAEQRILLLTGTDAEGQALTQPFEHTATLDAANVDSKRRRKRENGPEIPF
jgi:exodeoxyribonuclease VII small subunit